MKTGLVYYFNKDTGESQWEPPAAIVDPTLDETDETAALIECGICLDAVRGVAVQCTNGHLFCEACLQRHLASSRACPFCRVPIAQNKAIRNLLAERLAQRARGEVERRTDGRALTMRDIVDEHKGVMELLQRHAQEEAGKLKTAMNGKLQTARKVFDARNRSLKAKASEFRALQKAQSEGVFSEHARVINELDALYEQVGGWVVGWVFLAGGRAVQCGKTCSLPRARPPCPP